MTAPDEPPGTGTVTYRDRAGILHSSSSIARTSDSILEVQTATDTALRALIDRLAAAETLYVTTAAPEPRARTQGHLRVVEAAQPQDDL